MEHPTDICPTLQKIESDNAECVGAKGGYQYGRQPYPSWQQQYQPSPSQGQYTGQRFGPAQSMLIPNQSSYQQSVPKYQVPSFRQQQQQQSVGSGNILSQPIPNLKGRVSIVTLRSGKELPQQFTPQPQPRPELCMHKRKKLKGGVEMGGVVIALIKSEDVTVGSQQVLPKKCRDLNIFSIPCTISKCTFADAMLDLGASINAMPSSIYKSLNVGDLEPTGMIIQLTNRSVAQSLGILEDVLVQVNELIFPTDFYMLDVEDETFGKGSTLF
ncbi:hypothetical protein CR513_16515, partial [Mucuna pruriens]